MYSTFNFKKPTKIGASNIEVTSLIVHGMTADEVVGGVRLVKVGAKETTIPLDAERTDYP